MQIRFIKISSFDFEGKLNESNGKSAVNERATHCQNSAKRNLFIPLTIDRLTKCAVRVMYLIHAR